MQLRSRNNEIDYLGAVDDTSGLIDRRIFSDASVFDEEMDRIFLRAWLFVAHESQIPNTGDFMTTFMGNDRVIVVRDREKQPQVLLNTCRHRGNAVARAEAGHTSSFMCNYHGW